MAKEDVPEPPDHPPAKRRHLEDRNVTPDVWLAKWDNSLLLTPSERRRVREERERRKLSIWRVVVGLVVGPEGVTPYQFARITETLEQIKPTVIHHPGVSSKLHQVCKRTGATVEAHYDGSLRTVVRLAEHSVIAAPRSSDPSSLVNDAARFARHRSIPVTTILPNGGS